MTFSSLHASVVLWMLNRYDPGHTPGTALSATEISSSISSGNHWPRLCASCCAARTLPKPRATLLPNSHSARSARRPAGSTPRYAAESSPGPILPNRRVATMSVMRFGGIAAHLLACRRGRTYIRGNQPQVVSTLENPFCFNGAADLHPRKLPTRNPLRGNLAHNSLREVFQNSIFTLFTSRLSHAYFSTSRCCAGTSSGCGHFRTTPPLASSGFQGTDYMT